VDGPGYRVQKTDSPSPSQRPALPQIVMARLRLWAPVCVAATWRLLLSAPETSLQDVLVPFLPHPCISFLTTDRYLFLLGSSPTDNSCLKAWPLEGSIEPNTSPTRLWGRPMAYRQLSWLGQVDPDSRQAQSSK
jgi:hypothetical protein